MSIKSRLETVIKQICNAENKYGRLSGSVKLLAVSKGQPFARLQEAISTGIVDFGENYVQEAIEKIEKLTNEKLVWHFIGAIQSNKAKTIAEYFSWVHCVDRLKIVERLQQCRPAHLPPLNICIQVNLVGEKSKGGVELSDVYELAEKIQPLSRLKLRGLMTIPPIMTDFDEQRALFHRLHTLQQALIARGYAVDTLSMGMSDDFIAAIAEGATIVRIGTALFGARS